MPLWLLASVQYVLAYWVGGYLLGYVYALGFSIPFFGSTNNRHVIDTSHHIQNITKSRKIKSQLEMGKKVVVKSLFKRARIT